MDSRTGFCGGLALIALGSGGIKPCASAFVGDQFAQVVFDVSCWNIDFGSFFASLLMPVSLGQLGSVIAFGGPGC